MFFLFLTLLIFFSTAFGYVDSDSDLDGVDDSVDRCPDTPFDMLVNEYGCPIKEKKGDYYIKLYTSITKDKSDTMASSFLTLSYSNQSWYFSITGSFIFKDLNNDSGIGNTYLFGSYTKILNSLYIQLGLNLKVPTSKNSKKIDYTPSVFIDYYLNSADVFMYLDYSITEEEDFKNSYSISIGAGKQLTQKLYISFSFDYSSPYAKGKDDEIYLSAYTVYDFTEKIYFSALYSYGINKSAIDHYILGKMSYRF